MRSVRTMFLLLAVVLVSIVALGAAQEAARTDPRVGLKAGLRDAGQAARNMELISSLPKPEGFFDPKQPAGETTPPERDPAALGSDPDEAAVAL